MAQKSAAFFGIIFLIIGFIGFLPGNSIIGQTGYFHTDWIHNIVHIVIAIILFLAAKNQSAASVWLKILGVVYLGLFVNGLITPDKILGFIEQNSHDTWLHLGLGIVLLLIGLIGGKSQIIPDKSTV